MKRENLENKYSYENLFSLKNKIALISGAAGGLALETCLGLAQFGATLALTDINSEGLKEVSNFLKSKGIEPWCYVSDISSEESVIKLFNVFKNKFNRLDIMINFAGVAKPLSIDNITSEEFKRVININLLGSFLLAKYSLSLMIPQKSGKIILVGSVSGQIGRPFSAHYSGSKGGVHSITRTMAVEVAMHNIQVNCIAPVFTMTPMAAQVLENKELKTKIISTIPMGRLGLPSDLVGAMIFLSSKASDFITGQTIFIDGGCSIS